MSEFLALDWDEHQLVCIDARVASKSVQLRKWLRFEWSAEERPAEHPETAGKRLRNELDRAGIAPSPVLVSLPREEAIVRLLELPDCSDDELPQLVRFQAATRSTVPLDRLLLDYLPLPRLGDAPGRRVLMVTLGKPATDRIQTLLSSAGLQAGAIQIGAVGAAEMVAHQVAGQAGDPQSATLIVSRVGSRVEITAIRLHKILSMHAANLSLHEPSDNAVMQLLGETSRATVALAQDAPGVRIGSGWLLGSSSELAGLAAPLKQRFGFEFQVLETPFQSPGVRTDFDSSDAQGYMAIASVGLLLGEAGRLVEAIDFLHPRRQVAKRDRRRLLQVGAGVGALVIAIAVFGGIRWRAAQLDTTIAAMQGQIQKSQKVIDSADQMMNTAGQLEEWTHRDIDWIEQFHQLIEAIGGAEKLSLTSFDGRVATRNGLAVIVATGRAKSRDDVEALMNVRLKEHGYVVRPREILRDDTNREFPFKVELSLEWKGLTAKAGSAEPAAVSSSPGSAAKPAPKSEPVKSAPEKSDRK